MSHIRMYDVEPKDDHPPLPKWALEPVMMDAIPYCGDEIAIEYTADGEPPNGHPTTTNYWMVIRRSYKPNPRIGNTGVVLAVRFVS